MTQVVQAKTKYADITARKARLIIDMIRGMNANDAVVTLEYTNKKAARIIQKCIKSAIANATHNNNMNKDNLYIVEARANEAPTAKRGRPVARGKYHQILKRKSHITIKISDDKNFDTYTENANKTTKKNSEMLKSTSSTDKKQEKKTEAEAKLKKEEVKKEKSKKKSGKKAKKTTKKSKNKTKKEKESSKSKSKSKKKTKKKK
jgi:large subunit ribosomal protein L22